MIIRSIAMALIPFAADAADLFYKKNLSLLVIHDVDQGKSDSRPLDNAVGKFVADEGAVVYLKGQTLYQIRDTRQPVAEIIDSGVIDFDFQDGVIAYIRDSHLFVRRLAEDIHDSSRRVSDSIGVSQIDIAAGTVVFVKRQGTIYRVSDIARGSAERVVYPAGEVQVSGK